MSLLLLFRALARALRVDPAFLARAKRRDLVAAARKKTRARAASKILAQPAPRKSAVRVAASRIYRVNHV